MGEGEKIWERVRRSNWRCGVMERIIILIDFYTP